jgi:hypothetical protein
MGYGFLQTLGNVWLDLRDNVNGRLDRIVNARFDAPIGIDVEGF